MKLQCHDRLCSFVSFSLSQVVGFIVENQPQRPSGFMSASRAGDMGLVLCFAKERPLKSRRYEYSSLLSHGETLLGRRYGYSSLLSHGEFSDFPWRDPSGAEI